MIECNMLIMIVNFQKQKFGFQKKQTIHIFILANDLFIHCLFGGLFIYISCFFFIKEPVSHNLCAGINIILGYFANNAGNLCTLAIFTLDVHWNNINESDEEFRPKLLKNNKFCWLKFYFQHQLMVTSYEL